MGGGGEFALTAETEGAGGQSGAVQGRGAGRGGGG